MTLTTTSNRKDYTGNGAILIFAYDFLIPANADLGVYLDGVKKTLTTDYTVSGAGSPSGGNVTFVVAPANGVAVAIIREVAYTQSVDYVENQKFPADTHESALDRVTMLCQQLLEKVGRAATFKIQSILTNPVMADGVIGKVLRWKTTTELENIDLVGSGVISVPVSAAQGGTGADLSAGGAIGDLLIADAATTLKRIPVGGKGALLVGKPTDAVKAAWKTVGADGKFLKALASQPDGLEWGDSTINNGTARLVFTNATTLTLNPGQIPLKVSGSWVTRLIASAITISNAGLAANTTYFVYAQDSAGSTILLLSTTGHSTDSSQGVEIKTGDATQTLVGMVRTQGSTPGQFQAAPLTLTYFNRRSISQRTNFTVDRTTASATYVELNIEIENNFLTWADEDVFVSVDGTVGRDVNAGASTSAIAFDGTSAESGFETLNTGTSTTTGIALAGWKSGLAEGFHFATLLGASSGGGTSTWAASTVVASKTKIVVHVMVRG